MDKAENNYKAPAILRAAKILDYLAGSPAKPTLSELARELGLGKSTVHGLLTALAEVGWVDREGGGFAVGAKLKSLAGTDNTVRDLALLARPFMEDIAEKSGKSVAIGRLIDERMIILGAVEGRDPMRVAPRPGVALPFFAAASAKAFLSAFDNQAVIARLKKSELPRFTERTITDPALFLEEVEATRKRGYATDDEEYLRGIRAVAVPISKGAEPVAALWAVGFTSLFEEQKMESTAKELLKAASYITRLLSI